MTFLKMINMKVVAEMVAEAWDQVKQDTLQKSWQKIIPLPSSNPISHGSGIWCSVRIRIHSDSEETAKGEQNTQEENEELKVSAFQDMFKEMKFVMDADTIIEWLSSDYVDPGVY